ncbi:MAG: hypothetical protein ACEQR7_09795 [Agathobacter rectalis]
MSNVTIINITMQLQGPTGPSQDLTAIIDDAQTITTKTWSSDKIAAVINASSSINNSIAMAIALG